MGQVLHGCARTTQAVRRAIQYSQASKGALALCYDLNAKPLLNGRSVILLATLPWVLRLFR